MAGAPIGNQNARRTKEFEQALKRALARAGGDFRRGLDLAADKVVALAHGGERWAIETLADRIDGKPAQTVDQSLTIRDERNLSDAELAAIAAGSVGVDPPEGDSPVTH